jgi:hypothetical protein
MTDDLRAAEPLAGPDILDWRQALDDVERSLRDAGRAIALLRRSLEEGASEERVAGQAPHLAEVPAPPPEPSPVRDAPHRAEVPAPSPETALAPGAPQQTEPPAASPEPSLAESPSHQVDAAVPPSETAASGESGTGRSPFERLWDRMETERMEKERESLAEASSEPRGLDLLPRQYLVTVEDRESAVELAPLQRALAGVADMEDMSLVSFANGVPVISLRVEGELDLERLSAAVERAMDRECETIPQDNGRVYLRLRPRDGGGDR